MSEEEKAAAVEDAVKWAEDEHGPYRIDDKVWTMNEIRDLPLFMEDVPSDISDNPHLLALQSLVYDDKSPEELAEHFKQLGNEAFRMSSNAMATQNALLCYTRGLEMDCKDQALNSQLHSNRAAVSSRIGEHDKAINDCRAAIKLDPTNAKAYYRGAKASDAMGLTARALAFCKEAAKSCPPQKDMQALKALLKKRLVVEEEERERQRKADEEAEFLNSGEFAKVRGMLEERQIELDKVLFEAMGMYTKGAKLRPMLIEDEYGSAVQWPLLFLYDENGQSDFVESFDERCSLEEMLQIMFPPERRADWDQEGKYVWDRLVTYMEVYPSKGGQTEIILVDTKRPLQGQLDGKRVPPCLGIHVLVRSSPAWESFCVEKDLPRE